MCDYRLERNKRATGSYFMFPIVDVTDFSKRLEYRRDIVPPGLNRSTTARKQLRERLTPDMSRSVMDWSSAEFSSAMN